MEVKTVRIACPGYSIVADLYKGSDDKNILLVLPGYTSSRKRQRDLVSGLVSETGTSALVIDYSGHGDSPFELKDTRAAQQFLEVICAYDWIKEHYPSAGISAMGSSFGGFLAAHLTKYRELDKLVLKVPAIYQPESFYDLWEVRINDPGGYRIATDKYRTDRAALAEHPLFKSAANFKGKTLVMYHGKDELIPIETTEAFIKAFKADAYLAKSFKHSITDDVDSVNAQANKDELKAYKAKLASWLLAN